MVIPEVKTSSMNNWDGEEIKFEIDRDDDSMKKIVGILTSDLYKNKPGAVVRELSTNCLDAHRLNDSKEQFTIQIPTTYNNNFLVIRDYGPGLSQDDMKNLYTKYGKSTKDKVNDYTGCLGLGSKSPLSICSNFLVTSYHEDEVNTYSVYLNPDGEPALMMINSMIVHTEIDEENTLISSRLLLKSDYDEYNWYKNFLIAKIGSDNRLVFGIKLRPYFNSIVSDRNEETNELTLSNKIELNVHLLDNNRKLFRTLLSFNDKKCIDDYEGSMELNERLFVTSDKEGKEVNGFIENEHSIISIHNIDYNELDSIEQSRHNDGFSFFYVDLNELVPELGTNGYFIEAQQLDTDDENNKIESESNLQYQKLLNYTYDLEYRTGLKIEIPIASQYRSQIIQEVYNQLLFFPIRPRVIEMKSSGPELRTSFGFTYIQTEKMAIEVAPGVHLLKNNRNNNYNNRQSSYGTSINTIEGLMGNKRGACLLVQGGVSYPVELDLIQNTIKSTSRDPRFNIDMVDFSAFELYIKYLSDSMILFFDIGEISFNPSREGLNYDALTCIKIYDKIRQVMSQYKNDMISFLETSVDELELEQRLFSLKSTYNGLSLLSQFNNDNRYVIELAKTIKTATINGILYDLSKSNFGTKLFEIFKPVSAINDLLKVKTKMTRPALWERNKNSNDLFNPYDYNNICKKEHHPYFVLVDGKKYRKVINDHLRSIINHKFSKHYEDGIVKIYEDAPLPRRVIDSKATSTYKKSFGEKLLDKRDDYYHEISKQIYIIFEDHLNLENKPEDQSTEDYLIEVLGLKQFDGSAGFFPRILNYKKELKEMLEAGKIHTPTREKSRAFTGLGYMFPFSKFNIEDSKKSNSEKSGYKSLLTLISDIKNKNLQESDEFNIEDETEMDEFIAELEAGTTVLIPFDNKSKTFVNPFDDKPNTYKNKVLEYLMDAIWDGDISSYLWFLHNCGIINNQTNIVFAKHSICEKQDLSKYSLFEETKFLNHIKRIIDLHKNHNYIRMDIDRLEKMNFGGSYSNIDKIFDSGGRIKELTWKAFKKNPFTLNSFGEKYITKYSNVPASYIPGFAIDYFSMKESLLKLLDQSKIHDTLKPLFRKTDENNMVGFFYRLYYNYFLIESIDKLEEEYTLQNKDLEKPIQNMKRKVMDTLSLIDKPTFSICTISLDGLDSFKYKYPLYYEFIEAYTNITRAYVNQDDVNHYNYVLRKFLQFNEKSIQHMEGVFLNLFTVSKFESKLNLDNFSEKSTAQYIYSYPRVYTAPLSRHASKKAIRKHITGTKIFKDSMKSIKIELHQNTIKEISEIERKLFSDENIKQWFKNNQLRPAIGFNTTKELLSLCS